jgi:Flp pilus assembly protein TadB
MMPGAGMLLQQSLEADRAREKKGRSDQPEGVQSETAGARSWPLFRNGMVVALIAFIAAFAANLGLISLPFSPLWFFVIGILGIMVPYNLAWRGRAIQRFEWAMCGLIMLLCGVIAGGLLRQVVSGSMELLPIVMVTGILSANYAHILSRHALRVVPGVPRQG